MASPQKSAQTGDNNVSGQNKSHRSPRSESNSSRFALQKAKLEEMKMDAYNRLEGLQTFQFMIWSKHKFSEAASDEELVSQFYQRF